MAGWDALYHVVRTNALHLIVPVYVVLVAFARVSHQNLTFRENFNHQTWWTNFDIHLMRLL